MYKMGDEVKLKDGRKGEIIGINKDNYEVCLEEHKAEDGSTIGFIQVSKSEFKKI